MITHQKGFGQIIYIVLILIGVAAVGVYYYITSKGVPVETNNPTYTQLIPDTPDPTINWNTYKNQEYIYEMKYPQDWYVNELTGDHPSGKNFRMLGFSSPNKEYRLLFGLRKIGEDIEITSRTGVGAGDFAAYKTVRIGNTEVSASKLVYLDKAKEVYYSDSLGPGIVTVEGHEVVAEFGVNSDANYQPYENHDLNNVPELSIANQILSTFKFTNK